MFNILWLNFKKIRVQKFEINSNKLKVQDREILSSTHL